MTNLYLIGIILISAIIEVIFYFIIAKNEQRIKKKNKRYRFSLFNMIMIVNIIGVIILLFVLLIYIVLIKFNIERKIIQNLDWILVIAPPLVIYVFLNKILVVSIDQNERKR